MDAARLRSLLNTFNENAERVFNSEFNLQLIQRRDVGRITIGSNGIVTVTSWVKDVRHDLDAFILTYRLFFQNNERISIGKMNDAYQSSLIPSEQRNRFNLMRDRFNKTFDSPLITTWPGAPKTLRDLHDIVIYGELAHKSETKQEKFKKWDDDQLISHFMWVQFSIAVSIAIGVIDFIQSLNQIVINHLDAASSSTPP
jgi:hypothetical protein